MQGRGLTFLAPETEVDMSRMPHALLVAALILGTLACGRDDRAEPEPDAPVVTVGDFEVGVPIHHEGLTICPVYRRSREEVRPHGEFVTLPVALEKGLVEVTELDSDGSVPRLRIVNLADRPVFLSAGDVVKGGKQDRVVAQDVIVAAGAEGVPVDVLCVEHGRWSAGKSGVNFRFAGKAQVALKELAQLRGDQAETWEGVRTLNVSNNEAVGRSRSALSRSGTYLDSLDTEEIKQRLEPMMARLLPALEDADAVGVIVAYHGEPATLELYSHPRVFAQVREATLRSFVLETLSRKAEGAAANATREALTAFLRDALEGHAVAGASDATPNGVEWISPAGTKVVRTVDVNGVLLHCNAYAK
jgi:hypothetical protein